MKRFLLVAGLGALIFSCANPTMRNLEDQTDQNAAAPRAVTSALTLNVNLSSTIRGVTHCASGSLYGVTESIPAEIGVLVAPLNPGVFTQPARAGSSYQQPYGAAIPVAGRLTGTSGKVMIRLADICPNWPYSFPGMTIWLNQVKAVIADKKASGYSNFYGYEIWNEPCYTWNTANGTFNNLWSQTYAVIRANDPGAKIIGPSEGYYNYTFMYNFLSYCKANNCLPDILCWHELASNGGTGPSTVTASITSARAIMSSLGISEIPISINEYCNVNHAYEGAPGPSAPFIAKFERLKVDSACISWWWTAYPGRLGSILASNSARGGGWWFYHWYGAMTGIMVSVTAPIEASSAVDGFACVDSSSKYASLCFGGENNGTVYVNFNNIPSWFGSYVRVVVEAAPWTNKDTPVYQTALVSTSLKTVSSGKVSLTLTGLNSLYGYRILLLPATSTSPIMLTSGNTYKVVNLNSGKCLGITNASTAPGALALQWGDNGTADHKWTITLVNGYYRLKNVNSGLVLGISDMSTADGGQALQWSDNGTTDHDWTFTNTGSGIYKIANRNSGKSLAVLNMSSLDGGSVIQWSDYGTTDQRWVLVPAN